MVIPQWLNSHIQEADLISIEDAVHAAEKKTSAEIVAMVVRSSSRYYQTTITLILTGFIVFLMAYEFLNFEAYWDSFYKTLAFVTTSLVIIFGVLPRLARIGIVQRWMTHKNEEAEQVFKRAQIEFYHNDLHHTEGASGVLIFISLLEHAVVVLADKSISDRLPPETWQKIVDQILQDIKNKKMADGIKTAVASVAGLLTGPFPIKSGDRNELPNKLIIKE
jgi:putative membrane protein